MTDVLDDLFDAFDGGQEEQEEAGDNHDDNNINVSSSISKQPTHTRFDNDISQMNKVEDVSKEIVENENSGNGTMEQLPSDEMKESQQQQSETNIISSDNSKNVNYTDVMNRPLLLTTNPTLISTTTTSSSSNISSTSSKGDSSSQDVNGNKIVNTNEVGKNGNSDTAVKGEETDTMKISSNATSGKDALVKDREIATGTSHDKSVRSYSSYPKHLPPGVQQTTNVEPPKKPWKTYSFTLDPFQQQAVEYINKDESVLVAAHTSAGKTAVAEYAIAKSLQLGQRVIYTSPIKALSNQKFRDLQEEFGNVGLMTGDITINPDATALVMTTEILRSMLYRGSELIREVAWVIYDEVHYMRDSERGVVWEESIILLPHRVKFVFLSATIPNASQFADWITHIHHQPCHVVYTNYRPVPLQHYIFPQNGDGLHLVVDEKGTFRELNFQKAMASLQSSGSNMAGAAADAILNSGNSKKRRRTNNKSETPGKGGSGNNTFIDLHRIVKLIMERNLNPVIVFSFSKKDCERYALALNQEDYTDDSEKDLITQVYTNAIDSLGDDDKKLPQVEALLPLLKRGIGIHHGGLLPILKEIVEILFSEGLIKALFATETFSIGINMPAKTVVFTNTRKWDGKDFRWVTSGEYIQMSGRAGRRGKDDRGIVIQMVDEKMEPDVCKDILYGAPDPLNSSYRISYNMLLNLMRVEDVDPEYLLRASFHQFQREQEAPALILQAEDLEQQADNVTFASTELKELVQQYFLMEQQLVLMKQRITKFIQQPEYSLRFIQSKGRFVYVTMDNGKDVYGWGVVVTCKKKHGTGSSGDAAVQASKSNIAEYTIEVLLNCVDRSLDDTAEDADNNSKKPRTTTMEQDIENANLLWRGSNRNCRAVRDNIDDKKHISMRLFTIDLESIERISAIKIGIPSDITIPESRRKVAILLQEAKKRFNNTIPLLDPLKDMNITDPAFQKHIERAENLTERLATHELTTTIDETERIQLVQSYEKKNLLLEQAKTLRDTARNCQSLAMKDDLKKMKRVLKKLGHFDSNGVIQTKGRTACEINTAQELVVVELIFTGVFNDLSVEQWYVLRVHCLVFSVCTILTFV
jgi:ATP-dependent RNA helicase DOB1